MRKALTFWAAIGVVLAAGCRAPSPPCVAAPPRERPPAPVLSFTKPDVPPLALGHLPSASTRFPRGDGLKYRELSEPLCQSLAARQSPAANALDDGNRVPISQSGCAAETERLHRSVRALTGLELRNQAAAAALERYFQLADVEFRSAVVRDAEPILDELTDKATRAKAAQVRYPLDSAEIERQRLAMAAQLEQADAGIQALNVDLRRRLGFPPPPERERLWPSPLRELDAKPAHEDSCVKAALADRPELKAWRTLQRGLNANTLSVARERLGAGPTAAAAGLAPVSRLGQCVVRFRVNHAPPDPCAAAELEVRKQQLADMIESRERDIADETRVAVIALNSQTKRVALARDRVDAWRIKQDDAEKQLAAGIPMADLLVAQSRLEWLKARADLVSEVMAWHQARVRLRAAMGWLVEETP